jgi:hypothetical protein
MTAQSTLGTRQLSLCSVTTPAVIPWNFFRHKIPPVPLMPSTPGLKV